MKIKNLTLFAVILCFSAAAFGQSAKPEAKPEPKALPAASEIIANYVKAIGGRDAVQKISRRVATGTVELQPMGVKGTFESIMAAPGKSYTKMKLAGIGEMLEGFDGTTSWSINPIQGSREKTGAELLQVKLTNNFYRDINLEKLYPKMEVKGIEKVGGNEAYVLTATPEGLGSDTLYFDTKTGLLVRADSVLLSPEGNQNATIFYEDHRNVDGVKLAYRVRTILSQMEIVMNIGEIKHGGEDKPELFQKPKI